MELKKIVKYLNEYLKIDNINDISYNGLQYEGKEEVKKILLAVDAGVETIQKAIEENADMIIVHHGIFWSLQNPNIVGRNKKILDLLQKNNISFYGVHLPLDRHKEVGNNAQLIKILGGKITGEFHTNKDGKNVGWTCELEQEKTAKEIAEILNKELNTKCMILPFGKEKIKTIGVCSGGGGYDGFFEAINKKLDLYLTGEQTEFYQNAKDSEINVIFAGHHASETVGVKALAEKLKNELNIETIFVDIPTGL